MITLPAAQAKAKYGEGAESRKIRLKLLNLLYDLILNDDSIINDGFFVRDTVGNDAALVGHLIETISTADVKAPGSPQLREYVLFIL